MAGTAQQTSAAMRRRHLWRAAAAMGTVIGSALSTAAAAPPPDFAKPPSLNCFPGRRGTAVMPSGQLQSRTRSRALMLTRGK